MSLPVVLHFKQFIYTLFYILLTCTLLFFIVFLHFNFYFSYILNILGWQNMSLMFTVPTEEIICKFTFSLSMVLLLITTYATHEFIKFIKKGLYLYEYKSILSIFYFIGLVNILGTIIIGRYLVPQLYTGDIELIGKVSQQIELIINIQWSVQLLWIVPILFRIEAIKKIYEKNRRVGIFILALIIGLITPPDIRIMIVVVTSIVGIIEISIGLQIIKKVKEKEGKC